MRSAGARLGKRTLLRARRERPCRRRTLKGDRMTLPHVDQRESKVPPAAPLNRLVDPDHSERLKQARVLQRTGINWLETELTDELHHRRLPAGIVAPYLGNRTSGRRP